MSGVKQKAGLGWAWFGFCFTPDSVRCEAEGVRCEAEGWAGLGFCSHRTMSGVKQKLSGVKQKAGLGRASFLHRTLSGVKQKVSGVKQKAGLGYCFTPDSVRCEAEVQLGWAGLLFHTGQCPV